MDWTDLDSAFDAARWFGRLGLGENWSGHHAKDEVPENDTPLVHSKKLAGTEGFTTANPIER